MYYENCTNPQFVYTLRYRRLDDEDSVAVFGHKPTKKDVAEYLADNLDFELIDLDTFKDHSRGDEVIVKVTYDYFPRGHKNDLEFVAGYDDDDGAYFYCNIEQTFVNNKIHYEDFSCVAYLENSAAELIGIFKGDEDYEKAIPAIEKLAELEGRISTESCYLEPDEIKGYIDRDPHLCVYDIDEFIRKINAQIKELELEQLMEDRDQQAEDDYWDSHPMEAMKRRQANDS
jgi:hypothetical protein